MFIFSTISNRSINVLIYLFNVKQWHYWLGAFQQNVDVAARDIFRDNMPYNSQALCNENAPNNFALTSHCNIGPIGPSLGLPR